MHSEVKLAPEEVRRVSGIVNQAYADMDAVATGIGAHAGAVAGAYNGSGTATAMENYENLGRSGRALAHALDAISASLGLTAVTGEETDEAARGAVSSVHVPATASDLGIAAQI